MTAHTATYSNKTRTRVSTHSSFNDFLIVLN